MKDNVVVQWIVSGLAVAAFLLLLKFGVTFLPQSGVLGSIRAVVTSL